MTYSVGSCLAIDLLYMFMKKASLFPFDFLAKAVAVGKTTSQIISGERPWRKWARGTLSNFVFFFYIHSNYDDMH